MIPLLLLSLLAPPGVLDPRLETGPFEYFAATETRLPLFGQWAGPQARLDAGFRVTPEGDLAGPRGRLVVYLGNPPRPLAARVKHWTDGDVPVLLLDDQVGDTVVRVQLLAVPAEGVPGGVGLLRIVARATTAQLLPVTVGFGPDAGYPAPWPPQHPAARYELSDGLALRDGRALYAFPRLGPPARLAAADVPYEQPFTAADVEALPRTPLCLVRYELALRPGQAQSLVFHLPATPPTPEAMAAVRQLDFDEAMLGVIRNWTVWLAGQAGLATAEPKVTTAWRTSAIRLAAFGGPAPTPAPAGGEAAKLLAAPLVRGLVPVRDEPAQLVLSEVLSARRGRALLRAGRGAEAVTQLYALLLHSAATGEQADAVPADWGQRERRDAWGLVHDGRTAIELRSLLGEMVARDDGGRLRLLDGVAPAWLSEAQPLVVTALPSPFGPLSLRVERAATGLRVTLPTDFERPPAGIDVALPAWLKVTAVRADQQTVAVAGGCVTVPFGTSHLDLQAAGPWPAEPSFAATVAAYREAYRRFAERRLAAGGAWVSWRDGEPDPEQRRAAYEALHAPAP